MRKGLVQFGMMQFYYFAMRANGLRYLRVGGRGQCLGAEKTRSQKNAQKCGRIPSVQCTLCWVRFYFTRFPFLETLQIHLHNLSLRKHLACNPSDLATNHEASQNESFGRNTPVL